MIALAALALTAGLQQAPPAFGFPRFSPDGKQVMLSVDNDPALGETAIVNTDGTGLTRLERPSGTIDVFWGRVPGVFLLTMGDEKVTKVCEYTVATRHVQELYTGVNCQDVSWVPGKDVLVMAQGTFPGIRICTVDPATAKVGYVTPLGLAYGCSPSPDGSEIVFNWKVAPGPIRASAYCARVDGSDLWTLTDGTMSVERPVWSPDGKSVAYQASRRVNGNSDCNVYVVSRDAATTKCLTQHEGTRLDETPSWSPDGKTIAFQSNRSGAMRPYLMNPDGSDVRPLLQQ